MINFTDDDYKKIRILDTMFNTLSVEELTALAEADMIVSKLQGQTPQSYGPITKIYQQSSMSETEIVMLRGQVSMLEQRMQTLVRCLGKGMGDYQSSQDFSSLKSQLNIYP